MRKIDGKKSHPYIVICICGLTSIRHALQHNGSHSTVNSDDHGGCSSVNSSFRLNVPSHQAYYCKTAMYGNERVVVRMIRKKNIRFDRKLLEELHLVRLLSLKFNLYKLFI